MHGTMQGNISLVINKPKLRMSIVCVLVLVSHGHRVPASTVSAAVGTPFWTM
jgi:hypothetical protein